MKPTCPKHPTAGVISGRKPGEKRRLWICLQCGDKLGEVYTPEILYGDIRYTEETERGFTTVTLYDADDHDCIVLTEEAIKALYNRLKQTIDKLT